MKNPYWNYEAVIGRNLRLKDANQNHRVAFPQYQDWESTEMSEQEVSNISALLDSVSDKQLFEVLWNTDKKTLQFLLLKMMGFSGREISEKTGVSKDTINTKIRRLRKKLKKFS